MPGTKNSKPSRISKRRKAKDFTESPLDPLWALPLFVLIGAAASWWTWRRGYTLYYGDAEAHLNIARRIVDGQTPGYDQIGTVWLPLPHLLLLPFARVEDWWHSGVAGAISGVACYALAALFLFLALRFIIPSRPAVWAGTLAFALNPNLLYLQATPMTEPVMLACHMGLLYATVRFADSPSIVWAAAAGLAALAGSLTRYEGWITLPLVFIYLLAAGAKYRWRNAMLFAAIASLGPLYWLGHNWYLHGNALEFYNGPYSHRAIQGVAAYPGEGDWRAAFRYYGAAAGLCLGPVLTALAGPGLFSAVFRRTYWPLLLLAAPPLFYVLSMHSSSTPIFVPHLWPNTYYNTRYGLAALPLAGLCAAALITIWPPRVQIWLAAALVAGTSAMWLAKPLPESVITWKESQVNSETRRAWTNETARFLRENRKAGEEILMPFGDLTGILRAARVPIRETVHEGTNPRWMGTMARPDLFLRAEWVVAISADSAATMLQGAQRDGPYYRCVRMVSFKGSPVIEVHRRERRPPLPQ